MLSVTSIESCVDCGEYRNLVLCVDYRILCCAATIESCVVHGKKLPHFQELFIIVCMHVTIYAYMFSFYSN